MRDTALPAASALTMAMVSPPGADASAGAIARAPEIRARCRASRSGARSAAGATVMAAGSGEVAVAIGEGQLDRLDHDVDVVGLIEPGEVEALGEPEESQGRYALSGRGKARGHAAAP